MSRRKVAPPKYNLPPPRPKRVEEILAGLADEVPPPDAPDEPPSPPKVDDMKAPVAAADQAGPSSPSPALFASSNGASNGASFDDDDDDLDEDEDEDDDLDEDEDDLDEDEDEDDDDDLDEDEDEDEDEDDEPVAKKAPAKKAPAKKAPAKKAAPRGPAPRASFSPAPLASPGFRLPQRMQQEKINANLSEYDEMLGSIDFDVSKNHKILLVRVKPEWDPVTGVRIAGYLEEFRRPVTPEEIRAKYGGGEYTLTLQGPAMPDGTGRLTPKRSKNIEIAGDPITGPTNRRISGTPAQGSTKAADDAQLQLVKQVMESKEKDTQRLWAEQQEMKKLLLHTMSKNDSGIKDVVATALTGGGDLRRELMEERRLQEERIRAEREERQRELDRLTAERKRELEMAQSQHDKQLEIMRMQNERQLEQMRLENQRIMEEMRQRTMTESSASRDLLLFMQRMEAEKAATVQKQQELFLAQQQRQQELATQQATKQQEFLLQQQMQGQQMLLAQMQSAQQTKEQFLMEMLKESRNKKDDFFSTVEKMQQFKKLMGSMNGEEEDNRERWEKVLDRVGEAAPGIVAVASSFIQSRAQQQQQAQAPQAPAPQAQRVLPGSVAVADVELPAPPPPRRLPPAPAPKAPTPKAKAAPKPAPPKPAPPAPSPSVTAAVLDATKPPEEGANPLTDFAFPSDGMPITDSIPLLVQNIDLAIQREYPAQRIYDEVVAKFPTEVLTVLRLASVDQMIEILEQRAPGSWIVNSLVGTKRIEELHAILVG